MYVVGVVLLPAKSVVDITPLVDKAQLAFVAPPVKTNGDDTSLNTTVSPEADKLNTVPEKFPAIVPKDPAAVLNVGASDVVKIALDDLPAFPSGFSTLIKNCASVVIVTFATNVVALVYETVLGIIIAPVVDTISTLAPVTKLVPVIVIFVASLVIVLGDTPVTVGLVSPIVTDPPRETADPLIVIAEFAKAAFAIPPPALAVSVPPTVKFALAGTVTVSPASPS